MLTSSRTRTVARRLSRTSRKYHDESFGFRKPREFSLPDYSPAQLEKRATNAPLLRYVDALRTDGHRAARIDPLDLLQREHVPDLDPARYGLSDTAHAYDISGILWAGESEAEAHSRGDHGAPARCVCRAHRHSARPRTARSTLLGTSVNLT
ncbi:hypothetical protein FA95DRAFT_1612453 [Auriscalpium vulgare]|uniref:Uncharacterized protein n=1 Tax=Auriscalpium vulgare TaxID=40419 RepID=A0ACB8R631_9AGAM|nr:hypothetical protein FA95DRAFT_1612453 [Auriscalpium vulgare]